MRVQTLKIVVNLFFKITLTVLMPFPLTVLSKSHTHKKEKNKVCHHNIISMVFTLIEHSSRPISMQEWLNYFKKLYGAIHPDLIAQKLNCAIEAELF